MLSFYIKKQRYKVEFFELSSKNNWAQHDKGPILFFSKINPSYCSIHNTRDGNGRFLGLDSLIFSIWSMKPP